MRTTVLIAALLSSAVDPVMAQTSVTTPKVAQVPVSKSAPIPKVLVYRHFLAWVSDLNNKAVAAGESDPYKFAEPFQRARLETQDLDALLKEAKALDVYLKKHGERLKAVVAEYRQAAQKNATQAEIRDLETARIAILVQHMVSLQSALGPQKTVQLEEFLNREFVPHISLKPLARPRASIGSLNSAQSFAIEQQ